MRIVWNVLLFLLPFAVFFAYAHFANRSRAAKGTDPLATPWYWLVIAGLVLAIAGFFGFRLGADPHEGCYVRAHTDADGKVVAGYFSTEPNDPKCESPK
ncbi:MAG: DUF6111 family protein [Micropepsaceae bacterium]